MNAYDMTSSFKIHRFVSSSDKDFFNALKLYNDTIPVETKTSTNEIMYYIDQIHSENNRQMYFFGLYYGEKLIGYIESGYLPETKTVIIDYIAMKNEYRINGIFYPLFSLFQQFFSDNIIDYDYMVTEISMKTLEECVDYESFYSRQLLQSEDFRIVNIDYYQPQLGIFNTESNMNMRLMIKSSKSIYSLKKNLFIHCRRYIYQPLHSMVFFFFVRNGFGSI